MYRSMDVLCFISYVFIQCYSVDLPKISFSVAGMMPLKKPTTKKYPRAPKLQEPEVGEGSSPMVARQLEFSPKTMPVIKITTKKAFVQPPTFGDTEARIGTKEKLPHWGELFNKNSWE